MSAVQSPRPAVIGGGAAQPFWVVGFGAELCINAQTVFWRERRDSSLSSLAKQRPASSHRQRHNLSPRRPHNKGPLFDTLHSTLATTQPIRAVSYSPLLPFFFLPDARTVPWLRFRLRIFLPAHAFTHSRPAATLLGSCRQNHEIQPTAA